MPKGIYLKMPVDIEHKMFDLLKRNYLHAAAKIGNLEFKYIDSKIQNKLSGIMAAKKPDWVGRLFKQYECFYKILTLHKSKKITISKKSRKLIGAALFYFINPYDLIQDFVDGIGYADDYYIFILCIENLETKDRKLVQEELGKLFKQRSRIIDNVAA